MAPDNTAPKDAGRDVFPGCPLTFRLAEALRPDPVPLQRVRITGGPRAASPMPAVVEKLWHAQWPGATRWRMETPLAPDHHFSLLTLVRCEIQAIDQQWSLHRIALAQPGGERDDALASGSDFAEVMTDAGESAPISWPAVTSTGLRALLSDARRREDQVQRHAIRVIPHIDALLMVAEPAWSAPVTVTLQGETRTHAAEFVPRCRRWFMKE